MEGTFSHTIIYVEDVEKTVQFYEKVFDMKRRFTCESGLYAELETGAVALAFANRALVEEHTKQHVVKSTTEVFPFEICLTSTDVEGLFKQAVARGAKPVATPSVKPWGQTVAYVKDLNGILVELASPIKK